MESTRLVWTKIHLENSTIEGYIEQGLAEVLKRLVRDSEEGSDAKFELLQQQPRALPISGERREECERVDDAPLTYAEGAGRGDGGNEQISYAAKRV
jgi:hypothetical protein